MTTAEPTKDLGDMVPTFTESGELVVVHRRLVVDDDMVLSVTEAGELVVIHRRLVDPVVIDMTQLRNWLRRQIREIV